MLDHSKRHDGRGRVIVAFRGTYSIANTIVDLSTIPQEYVPYPNSPDNETDPAQPPSSSNGHRRQRLLDWLRRPWWLRSTSGTVDSEEPSKCDNCTVHTGFWTSWENTRPHILPHITHLRRKFPDYQLHLVGHSLGGAVAALAALEFDRLGHNPTITTFGEPRVGNAGLRNWIDWTFSLPSEHLTSAGESNKYQAGRYRRITHVDDPVPLLPLQEWSYRAHSGEVYISNPALQPRVSDLRLCYGDEDVNCIAGAEVDESWFNAEFNEEITEVGNEISESQLNEKMVKHLMQAIMDRAHGEDRAIGREGVAMSKRWEIPIPSRYKMWQLFFAHRDYFWRLGLCVPGGDPLNWGHDKYDFGNEDGEGEGAGGDKVDDQVQKL